MEELFIQPNHNTVSHEVENCHLDNHVFLVDQEQWQRLITVLAAPAQPSEALRHLLAAKAPWER